MKGRLALRSGSFREGPSPPPRNGEGVTGACCPDRLLSSARPAARWQYPTAPHARGHKSLLNFVRAPELKSPRKRDIIKC